MDTECTEVVETEVVPDLEAAPEDLNVEVAEVVATSESVG